MQIRYKINLWITSLGLLVNLVLVAIILFEAIELAYETLDEELEIAIREDFKPLAGMTGTVFDYQLFDRLLDFDEQYWIKVFDENKKTVFASPLAEQITIPFKETGEEYNYDIRLPEESPFFNGARYEKTVMPDREMAHGGESAYVPVTFRVHLYRFDMGGSFFHVQIARSVEALKHEIHELIYIVITGFFVATVLLLVLSFFLTKKILQPIVEINALAQDISASNMDRRIPLGKSQDELYMLSESLNRMFDRLQQSFASQKQLVADAAHELKSPITMLLLFMERSMERRDLPAEYADQLMTQVGILRRMGRLIKNLLDISLLELQDALHLERVDLEEMVDKLLDDFEVVFASAGIQVEKQVPSGCWIRGDREKLQRLLINLVDNAIKYNVERGRIKIGVTEKNDGIQLSVWNTGVGIPVEELHHVLKKFYRVEKSRSQKYGGSGLGLTIVHRIAELHGGDVLMESEPTKWCRATVFCRAGKNVKMVKSGEPKQNMQEQKRRQKLSETADNGIHVSIVVPFYNEEECLETVCQEIISVVSQELDTPWELIMVDDGSTDNTPVLIDGIARENSHCRALHLRPNSGQSAALEAGFLKARGELIATLDGDGQNDPSDLAGLIARQSALHVDMLCGIRSGRADSGLRKVSSRLANGVRSRLLKDHITDVGCSLRVFRRHCLSRIRFFKNAHRFFPALMLMAGFTVAETPVSHRPRFKGTSKYGLGINSRLWAGILDLAGVWWLQKRALKYHVSENEVSQ